MKKLCKYDDELWASRSEWEEVYKGIFYGNHEDLVNAHGILLAWKSRKGTTDLPSGLLSTCPLVEAKLALNKSFGSSDQTLKNMDSSFQTTIINRSLARFVSTAAKSHDKRHTVGKRMQDVAEEVNLPNYLVQFRNRLTHNECDYIGDQTRQHAIETSLNWIKINYWDKQLTKFENEDKILKSNEKEKAKKKKILPPVKVYTKKPKKLKTLIEDRVAFMTTHCSGYVIEEKEARCIEKLNKELMLYTAENPENAMKVLAAELFLSPHMTARMDKKIEQYHSPTCKFKAHSIKFLFKMVATHLAVVVKSKAINLFFTALIKEGKAYPETATRWMDILMKTYCKNTLENKIFRRQTRLRNLSCEVAIDWKFHAYTLFKIAEKWSIYLGFEMCKKKFIKISPNNLKKLRNLIIINQGNLKRLNGPAGKVIKSMTLENSCEAISTLSDVMKKAKELSPGVYEYVREICRQVEGKGKLTFGDRLMKKDEKLGVLNNQAKDDLLFKKIIVKNNINKSVF